MENVTSRDGTTIAFDRMGEGEPVVLVTGGSVDRMSNVPLAQELSSDFTVLNYDRRGRGPSGDTPPYAIEREIEDIEAMLDAAGGSANLYGTSSGAALALQAAATGLPVTKLALWEPPYIIDENARPPKDQVEQYETMVAEGRRGDAAEYFMTKVVGMPAGVRRASPERAVVAEPGGPRPYARVRREDHGRLLRADRPSRFREGAHDRDRRRSGHAVHA